jgi:hypothetical protein
MFVLNAGYYDVYLLLSAGALLACTMCRVFTDMNTNMVMLNADVPLACTVFTADSKHHPLG